MAVPDLYLEINEAVLNEMMAAAWHAGLNSCRGTFSFAGKVPDQLKDYAEADWRLTLNGEPLLDFRSPDIVMVRADAELELRIMRTLPLTFDAAVRVECGARVDVGAGSISAEPVRVFIDRLVVRNVAQLSDAFLQRLNQLLAAAVLAYLKDGALVRALPQLRIGLPLPGMPDAPDLPENRLPVQGGDVAVFPSGRMGVSLFLFGEPRADMPFDTAQSDAPVFLRLKQDALHRMYDFWWAHADIARPFPFDGEMALNAKALLEKGANLLTRILSLGFLQRRITMEDVRLAYQGSVKLVRKPMFELLPDGNAILSDLLLDVSVTASVTARVDDTLLFDTSGPIPDGWTPWQDDRPLSNRKEKRTLFTLSDAMQVTGDKLAADLTVTGEGALALRLRAAELALDLGSRWFETLPENLLNGLVKVFNRRIVERLPAFVLSPAVLLRDLRIRGMTPVLTAEALRFTEAYVEIGMGADVAEMKGHVPVPGYVANLRSKKVHRTGCLVIGDIRPENRAGYFVLHEALRDGFTACGGCLKGACVK